MAINNKIEADKIQKLDSIVGSTPFIIKLKDWIQNSIGCTAFFIAVFLAALIANGYYGTHFDLDALLTLYGVVYAKQVVNYGINSTFNSPKSEMPERTGRR